jgi:hypothetical protein
MAFDLDGYPPPRVSKSCRCLSTPLLLWALFSHRRLCITGKVNNFRERMWSLTAEYVCHLSCSFTQLTHAQWNWRHEMRPPSPLITLVHRNEFASSRVRHGFLLGDPHVRRDFPFFYSGKRNLVPNYPKTTTSSNLTFRVGVHFVFEKRLRSKSSWRDRQLWVTNWHAKKFPGPRHTLSSSHPLDSIRRQPG